MPFTNVYDTTFPADTQLANLLGQDIRNFKLDVQQRMAVISGLDASKPAFSGDAQPANWNGVLFFATDTGRVYQWVNPAWVDVTFGVLRGTSYKAETVVTQTGDVLAHTIYTITIPAGALNATSRFRTTAKMNMTTNAAQNNVANQIGFGAAAMMGWSIPAQSQTVTLISEGGNFGATNSQSWINLQLFTQVGGAVGVSQGVSSSGIDTTAAVAITLKWTPNNTTDSITFYGLIVEIF